jgi:hypothetical protein
MSLGAMTDEQFDAKIGPTEHPRGCVWGGFSCGFWLTVPGCESEHWERHFVGADGSCPCGTVYPGAANEVVFFDATEADEEALTA